MFIIINQKPNKKNSPVVKRGMSFLEAIIGIFIFSLVMLAVTGIFASSFNGYKKAQKMSKNIEEAQYAMNVITKSLRTSQLIPLVTTLNNATTITAYDYSESTCNRYIFLGGNINREKNQVADYPTTPCNWTDSDTISGPLTSPYVYGSFSGISSNGSTTPNTMGKVTIKIKICSELNCAGDKNDFVVLQTTVSLRDYETVEP